MNGLDRDEISRIIQDNGLFHGTMALGVVMDANHLERFANLVAAMEREACAKVCDEDKNKLGNGDEYLSQFESGCYVTAEFLADAIRARGNNAT
jgi:hypothetical protein